VLAIIPARGGSKGLPGKNILPLGGKPLIAWTIEAARQSRFVDRVIVSTDSPNIAEVAELYGAEVPFRRPAELASDQAKSFDVLLHAIDWHQRQGFCYDLVVCLQPTSPLRSAEDIDRAIECYVAREADAVVSVCETDHHPWWSNTLPEDGNMVDFLRPEVLNSNRQELPAFYRLNGAIYLASPHYLKANGSFYGDGTFAYAMPKSRSIDIDDHLDLQLAEVLVSSS
jgi:N-acylneuraminate cytidylyltransferase/CMP-N,N'-diacetyllegionaminic acid synthase